MCEKWPGKIIAVCDYKARDGLNLVLEDGVYKSKPSPKQKWNEGYRFWWGLSNVRRLPEPIPCRGNVGMWQLSESLAAKVEAAVGDRGVHASAQDGRELGIDLARERQGQDGSEEAAAGLLPKRGVFRFGNY